MPLSNNIRHPLIEINNIDLYRGGSCILQNFSLSIPYGCCCALIGPNGSGKTSIIMLLIRSLYPAYKAKSEIKILGRTRWNVKELQKRMGIISFDLQKDYPDKTTGREVVISGFFQSRGLYPYQKITGQMSEAAEEIMTHLGIDHLKDHDYARMSTGEQRRCLLARAWVHDPECLVLDEPTHGMDIQSTWQYLDTLRDWARRGKGLFLVTHHLNEIIPEVDTVILLKEGKIFDQGPKDIVLTGEKLSKLYGYPIRVFSREGYYFVMGKEKG